MWADVVCPWCYLGKRHLEAALELFGSRDEVQVIWRSFELDPTVDPLDDRPVIEVLAERYGSVDDVVASQAHLTAVGRSLGIEFAFEKTRNVNSFDAHRLVQFAAKFGLQNETVERLFKANFTDGLRVSDHEVLLKCAIEAGLDAQATTEVLASNDYVDDVRVAEATAQEIGVQGVPFYVIDRKYAVSGAQPAEVLLDVIQQAWDER